MGCGHIRTVCLRLHIFKKSPFFLWNSIGIASTTTLLQKCKLDFVCEVMLFSACKSCHFLFSESDLQ